MPTPVGRFPPQQRIRKRAEYQHIQSNARRVTTDHFVFLVYARSDDDGARLGLTVSRKVGHAPARNRAKRLIREAFRSTRELWPSDIDVVVIARRPTGAAKLDDVVAEWLRSEANLAARFSDARRDREKRSQRESTAGASEGPAKDTHSRRPR